MITVWTMCTGDAYAPDEVRTLYRQVKRHMSIPFIFTCITEHEIEGVPTQKPLPGHNPGFWGKVDLFNHAVCNSRNLWLDLDTVITGSLDELAAPLADGVQLRICKNWAQSGHGGCQSSVMYWEGTKARIIYDEFDPSWAHWPPRTDKFWSNGQVQYGDQEWITYLRDTQRLKVEHYPNHLIKSYKYHLRNGLPTDCRVAVFHGKPNPSEVGDDWVREARA